MTPSNAPASPGPPPIAGSAAARPFRSPSAADRLDRARRWLLAHPSATEVVVAGASLEAARELLYGAAREAPRGAAFGWRPTSASLLARQLAEARLAASRRVPLTGPGAEAVTARVVADLAARDALGRYEEVADTPGFVRALSDCVAELRLARLEPAHVRPEAPELAEVLDLFGARLEAAGLADPAETLAAATAVAADPEARHPLLDRPTLLLDVPVHTEAERRLWAAVLARAPDALATVPAGDLGTLTRLAPSGDAEDAERADGRDAARGGAAGGGRDGDEGADGGRSTALARLRAHLFEDASPPPGEPDETLRIFSAPGENRECVEIARRALARAEEGVLFDRMAVLLRAPEEYRAHLEEALARAGVPVRFDHGVVRPDPAGRAFLALLRCRDEGYSARRFAEYLSLGEVPDAPARETAAAEPAGAAADVVAETRASGPPAADASVVDGTLRAPRRWERLIVEASVVGGIDRWRRRLDGLAERFRLELDAVRLELDGAGDGAEPGAGASTAPEAAAEGLRRRIEDLGHLRDFALPLLEALAELPRSAPWGAWLEALATLAARSLRRPDRVRELLAELAPLGPVGPVDLSEVIRVLSDHLLELRLREDGPRYGRLFVGPAEAARGRSFDLVFVPGLADRLFPRKVAEEPVLLDAQRRAIAARAGRRLRTSEDRAADEQLALRLAVGAASGRVVLSYPRLDLDQSRPRVPSFYALEALRASEGTLPGFDDLARRADQVTDARVGWPAPKRREDAIDEAEYDLAVLEKLYPRRRGGRDGGRGRDGQDRAASGTGPDRAVERDGTARDDPTGHARYLLSANPHLARALRARAFRWEVRKWSEADGLVHPPEEAAAALRRYLPAGEGARPVSATALHHFATCPYKWFLSTVHRLAPREAPEAIETLDPLQKGSLIHDIQFACLSDLRERGLLPVRPATLAEGQAVLDAAVDRVAAEYRERLVPAIDRVWEDGIEAIRTDLRRWLRETAEDASGFVPWRFELAFGLPKRVRQDPDSRAEPVVLEAAGERVAVRGAIDLVERRESDGALRITDHKTGRARVTEGAVLDGGSAVQPVLYGLAAERLFPDRRVVAGRLYYCTSDGGFRTHEVPLDDGAREAMARAVALVRADLERGFLPALPAEGACRWCDYRPVCGPWEERRTARKEMGQARNLAELRSLR